MRRLKDCLFAVWLALVALTGVYAVGTVLARAYQAPSALPAPER